MGYISKKVAAYGQFVLVFIKRKKKKKKNWLYDLEIAFNVKKMA